MFVDYWPQIRKEEVKLEFIKRSVFQKPLNALVRWKCFLGFEGRKSFDKYFYLTKF